MSVRFDANTDRVSYVGGAGDPPSATFTVTLWAYLTAIDPGAAISVYRRYTSGGSGRGQIGSEDTADPTVMWWSPGRSFGHDLTVGQWSRLAIVVSGGVATSYAATAAGATVTASGSSGTVTAANLITLSGVSAGDGSEWLNGRLAYVRTWSAALSQAEVEAEWASASPVRTADLWADWPLTVHTDLTDHSGNSRHLTAGTTATTTEDGPPVIVPVPEAAVSLPLALDLAATAVSPPATVPSAAVALAIELDVAAAAATPPATVEQAITALPIHIGLSPTADRPAAAVPATGTTLPIAVGLHVSAVDGVQHDVTLIAALAAARWTALLGGSMTDRTINHLSVEHVAVDVSDGTTPVTGWRYVILPVWQEPTSVAQFTAEPTELAGKLGVLVGPGTANVLEPGEYVVWVRYVSDPEAPVVEAAGRITVTRGAAA